jgi:hypothetical protein
MPTWAMRSFLGVSGLLLLLLPTSCGTGAAPGATPTGTGTPLGGVGGDSSVIQHHNSPGRRGVYIEPSLTRAAAATMGRDSSFVGGVQGDVYAQPLFLANGPGGTGIFIVVTESDTVYALDESTGQVVWQVAVGTPAGDTGAGANCGNIFPLGITGTPYVDLSSRTLFFDAAVGNARTILTHQIHALSIDDGSERAGWPVDVSSVSFQNRSFNPVLQNQRGGLAAFGETLYVPYGGHAGDCGDYHGWVVAVPFSNPGGTSAFATSAPKGGIWGPEGLATDGSSVFAVTGNTDNASQGWGQGDSVLRLGPGATFSGQPTDFFAPSNWMFLDNNDLDLGGSGAMLIDVPGAVPSSLVVALGKDGVAYLLDRANLGGFGAGNGLTGEGVASALVAGTGPGPRRGWDGEIIGSPAAYATPSGTYVVFQGARGRNCPGGPVEGVVAFRIVAGSPPGISTAWCAPDSGPGSPIVTTTDGQSETLVWSVGIGGDGSQRLFAWNGETGALVFGGGGPGDSVGGIHTYTTPIAVNGRVLVAGDGQLYAFKVP